jgi:hypothetical protein
MPPSLIVINENEALMEAAIKPDEKVEELLPSVAI